MKLDDLTMKYSEKLKTFASPNDTSVYT